MFTLRTSGWRSRSCFAPSTPISILIPARVRTTWAGPAIIAAAFAAMLWWSWGTWPDVLVDFGRELYVPWQLTTGKRLYVDMAYYNGPLSPYLNALWFRLFGVSLRTLVLCNLALLAGLVGLLYRLLSDVADRCAATVACLVFLTMFAFAQLVGIGNYNFVCPYSHELTHGILLSVAAIGCLAGYQRTRRLAWIGAAGAAWGLAFLTKTEVSISAGGALVAGLGWTLWFERPPRRRAGAMLATGLGAAAIPPALAFGLLSGTMPAEDAFRGVLGAWRWVSDETIVFNHFYRWSMGTLDAARSLTVILGWTAGYAGAAMLVAALAFSRRDPAASTRAARVAILALVLAGVLGRFSGAPVHWSDAARPLPILMAALGAVSVRDLLRRRNAEAAGPRILRFTWILFAFLLLGKILLYARVHHYGFAHAMPAALVATIALVSWAPAMVAGRGGDSQVVRIAALVFLLAIAATHLKQMGGQWGRKTVRVSQGADAFLADRRGELVNRAVEAIQRQVGVHETLAVVPEGVMVNYLARRANPGPFINLMQWEILCHGEPRVMASFAEHPPDYVAVIPRDTAEYQFRNDGRRVFAWIQARYRDMAVIGDPAQGFGILLLKRDDGGSS